MSPRQLYRTVALAEAVTWALLLLGMVLKYVTETTELGVRIFGMAHGVVFIAYCVVTVLVATDCKWSGWRTVVSLAASIPPFGTLAAEWWAERSAALSHQWRLRRTTADGPVEQLTAWLVRRPALGAITGAGLVAALTGLALVAGPPAA